MIADLNQTVGESSPIPAIEFEVLSSSYYGDDEVGCLGLIDLPVVDHQVE